MSTRIWLAQNGLWIGPWSGSSVHKITKIIFYNPNAIQYVSYDISDINEYSTYYLYETFEAFVSIFWPNNILDYYVSSSKSILTSFLPIQIPVDNYNIETGNALGYFDSNQGTYTLGNTPNTPLLITASFTVSQSDGGSPGTCSISFINSFTIL